MLQCASFRHSRRMICAISLLVCVNLSLLLNILLFWARTKSEWESYIADHLQQSDINEEQLEFIVELCDKHDDLVRARFQSRHLNRKKYIATVQFNEQNEKPITGWYCTCSAGGREVGMCSHVTALLWHMGVERTTVSTSAHPLSASKLLTAIDDSMKFSDDENNLDNDNDDFRAFTTTNENNEKESDW